jgi:hypothetical protein
MTLNLCQGVQPVLVRIKFGESSFLITLLLLLLDGCAARIGELQEEGRNRHDITVASLTEQLQDAYGLAMLTGHVAVVGATWALPTQGLQ